MQLTCINHKKRIMKYTKLFILLLATSAFFHLSAQSSSSHLAFTEISESLDQKTLISEPVSVNSTSTFNDIKQQLANKINYPVSMMPYEIEGISTVQLTITKNGILESFEILESLGIAFDSEIKKTLNRIVGLSPILYDGVPKKQTVVFPIQFRL